MLNAKFSTPYVYLDLYVYWFSKNFHPVLLFGPVRLFGPLEYLCHFFVIVQEKVANCIYDCIVQRRGMHVPTANILNLVLECSLKKFGRF